MPRNIFRTVPVCFLVASLTAGVGLAATHTNVPCIGDVKSMPVITVSLSVGSTGREVKRVTYAPPPGWYVRGHRVECKEKAGLSSFTVNTLPREWSFLSEEQVKETYHGLMELAAKAQNVALGAKLAAEQEKTLAEVRKARSSHHVLMVEATVTGEGFLRSGGSLYLTVIADIVFVGTPEDIARAAANPSDLPGFSAPR